MFKIKLIEYDALCFELAMLSPPRLPVLCIAFHADACVTSQRASTGLTQA